MSTGPCRTVHLLFLEILFIYKISLSVMGQAAICKLLETYTFSSIHNLHNKKTTHYAICYPKIVYGDLCKILNFVNITFSILSLFYHYQTKQLLSYKIFFSFVLTCNLCTFTETDANMLALIYLTSQFQKLQFMLNHILN